MSYNPQQLTNVAQMRALSLKIASANSEINFIAAAEINNALTLAETRELNRQQITALQSQINDLKT